MKNSMDGLNSKMEMSEERISELKNILIGSDVIGMAAVGHTF